MIESPMPPVSQARFAEVAPKRMTAIAKLALKRGSYGYALFED